MTSVNLPGTQEYGVTSAKLSGTREYGVTSVHS